MGPDGAILGVNVGCVGVRVGLKDDSLVGNGVGIDVVGIDVVGMSEGTVDGLL